MLARLIEFSLTQRLLVLVAALILIGGGAIAFNGLPIDAFPDVSSTQVKVIMKAPGLTPEEVEARIVTPVEVELLGIPSKRMLRSVSKYGIADVTVDFEDGTDLYWARQQVAERLAGVAKDLPAGASGGLAPISHAAGRNADVDRRGRSLTGGEAHPARLDHPPGCAHCRGLPTWTAWAAWCAPTRCSRSSWRSRRAACRSPTCCAPSSPTTATTAPARLTEGEESLLIRVNGSARTIEDLRAIVVHRDVGGRVTRLGDVATVRIGSLTRSDSSRAAARRRPSRASCSACAAPTPGPWSVRCAPGSTRSRRRCRRA